MLSKKTKYALNALRFLSRKVNDGPQLIAAISEEEHIPRKFLEAILLELKKQGILKSKMGKGGGYTLAKQPSDINLAEIIRIFDGGIGLIPCVTHNYYEPCDECPDETTCGIRSVLIAVKEVTVSALKNKSLQDILDDEKRLTKKRKA